MAAADASLPEVSKQLIRAADDTEKSFTHLRNDSFRA